MASRHVFRRFFSSARPNLKVIADNESYEAIKTSGTKMMVGWFSAHWSAAGKLYESKFDELAGSYPSYTFYKVDVDAVPKAAYDMEVPTVAVLPLGPKPDGTLYDKTDLQVISAPQADYGSVVADAKTAIDSVSFGEGSVPSAPWKYDPATGTTLPPHQTP